MAALQNSPMSNPEGMMGMLKNNLFMMILFPMQYGVINYFFSGMLIGKTSFPITQQFRQMLQQGMDLQNLDVKYISALSLFFLSYMGIEKFFSLVLTDEKSSVGMEDMQGMGAPPMMPTAAADPKNSFKNESNNIKTLKHEFFLKDIEEVFLRENLGWTVTNDLR